MFLVVFVSYYFEQDDDFWGPFSAATPYHLGYLLSVVSPFYEESKVIRPLLYRYTSVRGVAHDRYQVGLCFRVRTQHLQDLAGGHFAKLIFHFQQADRRNAISYIDRGVGPDVVDNM
jgi:hypothetical protein